MVETVQNVKCLLTRSERKASLSVPGSQLACESPPEPLVNSVRFLPSAAPIQMWLPVARRHRLKATFSPSGEKRGRVFRALVSEAKTDGGPAASPFGSSEIVNRLLTSRFAV